MEKVQFSCDEFSWHCLQHLPKLSLSQEKCMCINLHKYRHTLSNYCPEERMTRPIALIGRAGCVRNRPVHLTRGLTHGHVEWSTYSCCTQLCVTDEAFHHLVLTRNIPFLNLLKCWHNLWIMEYRFASLGRAVRLGKHLVFSPSKDPSASKLTVLEIVDIIHDLSRRWKVGGWSLGDYLDQHLISHAAGVFLFEGKIIQCFLRWHGTCTICLVCLPF